MPPDTHSFRRSYYAILLQFNHVLHVVLANLGADYMEHFQPRG
jgi:hypothetical protein